MYRRSQASIAMKNYDEAKIVLTEANKLDPENKGMLSRILLLFYHYRVK